jgi:hypothetical protein
VIFVVVILAVAIFIPHPSPFAYTVFRIVLALAAAGVAAMIPGFIDVVIRPVVRAGGAIAVFVIVFFFSPAQLAVEDEFQYLRGREAGRAVGVIVAAIERFQRENGEYPKSLSELGVIDQIEKLGASRVAYDLDPENGYVLRFAGQDNRLNTTDDKVHRGN